MLALLEREKLKIKKRIWKGYKMIESITIDNFRCFKHLELNELRRVNVIVGGNSSGKTALLESVFVVGGNPEALLRIRQQRMGMPLTVFSNKEGFEALWHHLFFNFDEESKIEIKSKGTGDNTRAVKIAYNKPKSTRVSLNESSASFVPLGFSTKEGRLLNEWKPFELRLDKNGEIEVHPTMPSVSKLSYYPSNIKHSPDEAGRRFSDLSKKGNSKHLVETVKLLYPFVEDLTLEIDAGSPMVFASVKGLNEKVPMQILSEGTYRMLAILIGIANTSKGVVLIDEIENGLYYETYEKVWQTLYKFAEVYQTQLFVTTHSKECLNAMHSIVTENANDFTLLRVEKDDENTTVVRQFTGDNLISAIEIGVDPR